MMCSTETWDSNIKNVGIVADDLTGACDSGVEFMSCSSRTVVVVEPGAAAPREAADEIVIYNTQSRKLSAKEAYRHAFEAAQRALSGGADLIFKKVDSALRGNLGIEVKAVMDAAEAAVAFILPAIPEAGRKTISGVQHIGGVPIAETFYARDPEHPVTESSVLRRAEEGSGRKAGLVSLDDLQSGKTAEAAVKLHQQGCDLIVVDGESERDLQTALEGLVRFPQRKVFVGCQGLARALAAQLPARGLPPCRLESLEAPMLCLCGTLHPRTRRQLEVAAESKKLLLLEVHVNSIAESSIAAGAVRQLGLACREAFREGRSVAVCFCGQPTAVPAKFFAPALRFLSNFSLSVVGDTPPGTLFLTGGETAFAICHALGIRALKLHARISPLVVGSRVLGGPCHDMLLVTKGGSIGPEDLLCRIHDFIRSEK